jgi:hypothetical protein
MTQAITKSPVELLEEAEGYRQQAEQSFGQLALEAGKLLLQAKKKIPHGQWAEHVQRYTKFSLRTAEVYMRARRRWDQLPAREREEVLQQPFTRSLLVISQAPRATPPPRPALTQPQRTNGTHAPVADSVETYLREHDLPTEQLETTQLLNEALDFEGQTTTVEPEEEFSSSAPEVEHEATPLDDILDAPETKARMQQADDGIDQAQLDREMQEEFDQAINEVSRLEGENRRLQRELAEARQQVELAEAAAREAAQAGAQTAGVRGWDVVQGLFQYLRADETQRTPESLARRAAQLPNDQGRTTIAFLAMFMNATLNHLQAIA